MQTGTPTEITERAIDKLESMRDQQSSGKWLEDLTAYVSPYIKEWDIARCWAWTEWPDRENGLLRLHQSGHRHRRRGRAA